MEIDQDVRSDDTAPRRRLTFSMRTLTVLISLFCVYLACWRITAKTGVTDAINQYYGYDFVQSDDSGWEIDDFHPWVPMPMIIRIDEPHFVGFNSIQFERRYYFWFFFGAVRIPFQGDGPPGPAVG